MTKSEPVVTLNSSGFSEEAEQVVRFVQRFQVDVFEGVFKIFTIESNQIGGRG